METVSIICIRNPWNPHESKEIKKIDYTKDLTIQECISRFFPLLPPDTGLNVAVNGHLVENIDDIVLQPDYEVVFCIVPKGGGGGGKNPLKTIALLAVMVVATVATYGVAGSTWAAGGAATMFGSSVSAAGAAAAIGTYAAINLAGAYLVNTIFPSSASDLSVGNNLSESATYSWSGATNAVSEGVALPVTYGRVSITPPIIGEYIGYDGEEQYLNVLYALSDHHINMIENFYIDEQDSSTYDNFTSYARLGTKNQLVIPNFTDTYSMNSIGITLDNISTDETDDDAEDLSDSEWSYMTIGEGESVTAFKVHINFPDGFVHTSSGYSGGEGGGNTPSGSSSVGNADPSGDDPGESNGGFGGCEH